MDALLNNKVLNFPRFRKWGIIHKCDVFKILFFLYLLKISNIQSGCYTYGNAYFHYVPLSVNTLLKTWEGERVMHILVRILSFLMMYLIWL